MDRREIALRASKAAEEAARRRRHERYIRELEEAGYAVALREDVEDEMPATA